MDIDALIAEGISKHRQMTDKANEQVGKLSDDLKEQGDGLDMTQAKIDMFKFQDQDF